MEPSTSKIDLLGSSVVSSWLDSLHISQGIKTNDQQHFATDPSTLVTSSTVHTPSFNSGSNIYRDHLIPALQAAEHEVILVTCFWASSASLSSLSATLRHLSQKALSRGTGEKIRVRLCFSSRSLLQKLFHTSSSQGCTYPPPSWTTKLGLPAPDQLAGLDLQVKSLFFRPFSVLHSKFVIVDRRLAYMPSCNVSWEQWCECVVAVEGLFVERLFDFWHTTWAKNDDLVPLTGSATTLLQTTKYGPSSTSSQNSRDVLNSKYLTTTILLPSRHHSSLLASFPFLSQTPPPTPLNTFLLTAFTQARHSILLITPNITAPPVHEALLAALERGVNVDIVTNRRMMVVEQLVTAGTLTEISVWKLVRAYRKLRKAQDQRYDGRYGEEEVQRIEEGSTITQLGSLKVQYFRGLRSVEARKVHVKCSVFDERIYVLGSGNMDRASWFTSQELGIALLGDFSSFVGELMADLVLEDYFG